MSHTPTPTEPKPSRPKGKGPIMVVNLPKGTRWPNIHEWAFAIFAFFTYDILTALKENPALLGIPAYMQFVGQIVTGGILAAAAWLWTSNKAGEQAAKDKAGQPITTTGDVATTGDVTTTHNPPPLPASPRREPLNFQPPADINEEQMP